MDAMKEEYPPRRASERHNRFLPLRLCSSGTKAVARMWRLRQMTDTPRRAYLCGILAKMVTS